MNIGIKDININPTSTSFAREISARGNHFMYLEKLPNIPPLPPPLHLMPIGRRMMQIQLHLQRSPEP